MKKVTLKIPDNRLEIFRELIRIMDFEIYEETEISGQNKTVKKDKAGNKIAGSSIREPIRHR